MMNPKVATGPGTIWVPTRRDSASQASTRVSRPASRNSGLASLPTVLLPLLRVVLGGEGACIEALHADDLGTGDGDQLVDQIDKPVDHLLVPFFRYSVLPAGTHRRED